ncbi:MAG TPA: Crp/Fnr family transcriptional regulator [Acetobacteraceae bacterium]|nr:Crp/Fnr family transcriptional regulator [Acetobacteraceae bacterium]
MLDLVPSGLVANSLLRQIPEEELARLRPSLSRVELVSRQVLYEARAPIEHAYFPETALVALIAGGSDDALGVEVGMIGREGLVGLAVMFDVQPVSFARTIVQLPGFALRIRGTVLRDAAPSLPALRELCFRYVQATLAQAAQSAACNVLHPVHQRLAKLILLTLDRVGGDDVALNHEFLANMLGVRRPGVTVALGALQHAGVIQSRRGRIKVLDRACLEASACSCYTLVSEELERLLPWENPRRSGSAAA